MLDSKSVIYSYWSIICILNVLYCLQTIMGVQYLEPQTCRGDKIIKIMFDDLEI